LGVSCEIPSSRKGGISVADRPPLSFGDCDRCFGQSPRLSTSDFDTGVSAQLEHHIDPLSTHCGHKLELQLGCSLGPDRARQRPGPKLAEFACALVEPQGPQLVLLRVAPDEIGGRRLRAPAAPLVERVECDYRNEGLPPRKLIFLYGVARRDDLAAKAYPLHRLDDRAPFADAIGIAEEGSEVLLLAGASVEHTGLGKDRACRRR